MRRLILAAAAALTLAVPGNAVADGSVHDHASERDSVDRRGATGPSAAQRAAAERMGARVRPACPR